MIAYVVTAIPGLPEPVRITRIGAEERDVPVAQPTIRDAARAILADYYGIQPSSAEVRALHATAFGGLEGGACAITVRAGQVERVRDAVGRVS